MSGKYDDIMYLPYPYAKQRPGMSMIDRAAQFSPFAALSGYEDVLTETGRQTRNKVTLSEDEKYMLDLKQTLLQNAIFCKPYVTITYFLKDSRKSGGSYATISGNIEKISLQGREYILKDGTTIPFDDVLSLESDLFQNLSF